MLFIDIETSSPNPEKPDWSLDPRRSRIDLIGYSGQSHDSPIVIVGPEDLDKEFFYNKDFCAHNGKFDYKTLHHKGYRLNVENQAHDTLVMATASIKKVPEDYLERYEAERKKLNSELPSGQAYRQTQKHSLKVLAPYFLGVSPFYENPLSHNDPEYLKKDVLYTKGLYEYFDAELKRQGTYGFYLDKLMAWTRMTLEAELDGIHIDLKAMEELKQEAEAGVLSSLAKLRQAWKKVEEEYEYKEKQATKERYAKMQEAAKAKIKAKTPEEQKSKEDRVLARYSELCSKAIEKCEPFNYASPSQLLWAFKEVLHYPVINMEGDETTGASVLEMLAAQGKEDIKALLDYKGNYKLAHSYFPSYQEMLVDGKLNCNFNIHGARTGRLSSSSPNLQQCPSKIKRMFKAAPGNFLVKKDLSAIEIVLIAYFTEDRALCKIIQEGQDFHGVCTVDFFNLDIDPSEVKTKCPEMRYAAKQGDLSISYGSSKKRLYTTLTLNGIKEINGQPLTEQMCAKMVYKFRDRFKGAWEFKEMLDAELKSGGVVENMFGRKYVIEDPQDVYMRGFNQLIQGSASDLLLKGTQDCLEELRSKGIWCQLRLVVHDEACVECRKEDAPYVDERLNYHLTKFQLKTKHGLIPLKTEGNYGETWAG